MSKTFIDILLDNCSKNPSRLAYIYLLDGEKKEITLTYEQLIIKARMLAHKLGEHTERNDRVILFYPPGLEYIIAFYACMFQGLIAVPAYPPELRNTNRISSIIKNSKAKIALCSEYVRDRGPMIKILSSLNGEGKNLKFMCTDVLNEKDEEVNIDIKINDNDLAFLQYTSGSTSTPKGVKISHENLVANCSLIEKYFSLNETTIGVSWLPPYHDMGLIGGLIEPIYKGITSVSMSPASFSRKPLRWLNAISHYGKQGEIVSGGPNFAYEMCCKFIAENQIKELNLSNWVLAYNGAEPIRAETLRKFTKKFREAGFSYKSFNPVYGMAEGTLIISSGLLNNEPVIKSFDDNHLIRNIAAEVKDNNSKKELVSSGNNLESQKIVIADPVSWKELPENQIGEVWVKGPSITKGYWENEDASKQTLQAYLQGTNEGPFLRTGDLGFFDNDKNLFITGRIKDLIIIRGHNYYPHDIEETIEETCEYLRPSCGGAFSIDHKDEEVLVIAYELKRKFQNKINTEDIKFMIKDTLAKRYGLVVHDIALITTSSFPKTSSGKPQRHLAKEMYLNKELKILK